MRHKLHDEIDTEEALRERARRIVEAVVRSRLPDVMANLGDIDASLMSLAEDLEEALAPLARDAFQSGHGFAKVRDEA